MLRKSLIQLLATLLVALPLLGVFAKDTHAASSRIAVIKAMSGDVTVKKAGGSKAFRAFKKLSLNQGDQLMTGDDGTATLQFSNGTSSDDEMTVSANTTLTFSKLSSRKGSVTKVSMLKGTVWSDVKSIQNKDDEFQLETPTAIMGVRGTHFLSTVSPVSQSSQLVVLAGVVQVSATGGMQPLPAPVGGSNGGAGGLLAVNGGGSVVGGSSPSGAALSGSGGNAAIGGNGTGSALIGGSGSGGVVYVYPSQQIYLPGVTEPIPSLQQQISTVDIQQIVQQAGPEVLKAILQNVADIEKEQQEQKQKLPQSGSGDSLSQPLEQLTLDKLQANLNALLPAILNQAIKQNQVSQAAVQAALNEAVGQIDMTIQQLPVDNQQQKQIEKIQQQKEKLEALVKEQQKQQLEKAQQQLASVLAQIQQQMNQIAQANQQAQQQKQQQTENQYVSTLTEAQKAAYEAAKQQNQGKTPTTPSTPAKSTNAQLGSLSVSGAQLSPAFQSSVTSYAASVGSDVSTATLAAAAADSKATVKVNGTALSGGSRTLTLAYGTNEAAIEVTAEDGTTKLTYTVQIVRQLINNVGLSFGDDSPVQIDFTSPNPSQEVSVPASSDTLELTVPSSGPALTVTVNGSTVTPEPVYTAALAAVPGPIAWKYKIPLSGGNNTIQLTAIVDGVSKTYTIVAVKPVVNVATLSGIRVDGSPLSGFASATFQYALDVPNGQTSLSIEATPSAEGAHAVVSGNANLAVGANTVTIVVTAKDGVTKRTYTITVTRAAAPLSTDATLSGLSLSSGAALNETFSSAVTSYTANVANAVSSVTVTPTKRDANATVTVNGQTASTPVTLAVGSTTITVVVTAQDGTTTKTYKIVVTRAAAPLSTDATLSGLSLSGGAALNETFSSSVTSYTANVANSVSSVTVTLTTTDANATVTVNGQSATTPVTLAVGSTTITVAVTAQNGTTTKTYKIVVTRAAAPLSTDATLSGLSLSSGATLNETFSSAVTSYTANVANSFSSITVTPTTTDANATVTVNGASATTPVTLAVGSTTITVVVTAQDGATTKTYKVVVTRAAAPLSTDATLSGLSLSDSVTLNETFSSAVTSYTANVANSVSSVTVTPTTTDANATVTVNGASATTPVTLAVGTTTITVVVTAQDGTTTKSYTITVTRAAPSLSQDATLSGLSLSSGATLNETFSSAVTSYTADVVNSVSSVTLTPTTTNANATVTVNGAAATTPVTLAVGTTTITVVVTAQDGTTTKTYTVTVTRAAPESLEATLSNLSLSAGTLTPAFDPMTTSYSATVDSGTEELYVTPTLTSETATIVANGSPAENGTDFIVPLSEGENEITIVVTGKDTTTKTYTVTVTREAFVPTGLNTWTTTANDSAAEWKTGYSNIYAEGNNVNEFAYYDLYLNSDTLLQFNFGFADTVTSAEISEYNGEGEEVLADLLQSSGLVQYDADAGIHSLTVTYEVHDGDIVTSVRLYLMIFVGKPQLYGVAGYQENGFVPIDILPSGTQRFTAFTGTTLDGSNRMLASPGYLATGIDVSVNGEPAGRDGYYYLELNEGWNEVTIDLYYGDSWEEADANGLAVTYTLDVYNGDSLPSGIGLNSVSGTGSGAGTVSFEQTSDLGWSGNAASGDEYVDLALGAPAGSSVVGVLLEDYESYAYNWAEQAGDAYRIPLESGYATAYVVTETDGHLWTHTVDLSPAEMTPPALSGLSLQTVSGGDVLQSYAPDLSTTDMTYTVPAAYMPDEQGTTSFVLVLTAADAAQPIEIDGTPYDGGVYTIAFDGTATDYAIEVFAADRSYSATYTLHLVPPMEGLPPGMTSWQTTFANGSPASWTPTVITGTEYRYAINVDDAEDLNLDMTFDPAVTSVTVKIDGSLAQILEPTGGRITLSPDGLGLLSLTTGYRTMSLEYDYGSEHVAITLTAHVGAFETPTIAHPEIITYNQFEQLWTGATPLETNASTRFAAVGSDLIGHTVIFRADFIDAGLGSALLNEQSLGEPDSAGRYYTNGLVAGWNTVKYVLYDKTLLDDPTVYTWNIWVGDSAPVDLGAQLTLTNNMGQTASLLPSETNPMIFESEIDANVSSVTMASVDGNAKIEKVTLSDGTEVAGDGNGDFAIPLNASGTTSATVVMTADGYTSIYTLNLIKVENPILTSAKVWYTAGSGYSPLAIDEEMNLSIPANFLTPDGDLPLAIDLAANNADQQIDVYSVVEGVETALPAGGDGRIAVTYHGSEQDYKIIVTTSDGGNSRIYWLHFVPQLSEATQPYNIQADGIYATATSDGYALLVTPDVTALSSLTFTLPTGASASVTLNGSSDGVTDKGDGTYAIALNASGPNALKIAVMAEAGNTAAYTVNVYRDNDPNVVLDSIAITDSTGVTTYTSSYFNSILDAYIFSGTVLSPDVTSLAITPTFGANSEDVYATLSTNLLDEVPATEGSYTIPTLNFGWNNLYIKVYEPNGEYDRAHKLDIWKQGTFELWADEGSAAFATLNFNQSYNNTFAVNVPNGVSAIRLKSLLPSAASVTIHNDGSDAGVNFADFADGEMSDAIAWSGSPITIKFRVQQSLDNKYIQSMIYTITLNPQTA